MKVLIFGDSGVPSGFGRICDEIGTHLVKRGIEVFGASMLYDGLLPPTYEGKPLPYTVSSLAEHPNWPDKLAAVIRVYEPDVVICIQDAPYSELIYNNPATDWSKYAFIIVAPVDGVPLHTPWIKTFKAADAIFSISEFGVEAMRKKGVDAQLLRMGVDTDKFYPLPEAERLRLRRMAGIADDAFVFGTVAANQGRKAWPAMLTAFFQFAAAHDDARYLCNTDPVSPAGWDIPTLCEQNGWDVKKLLFRDDLVRLGLTELNQRYNIMTLHGVIAFREGFGMPLLESQAAGIATCAMDYCSGTEVCGNGLGYLIPPIEYKSISTWGGAYDRHPNIDALANLMQHLYDNPEECRMTAKRGNEAARKRPWTDAVQAVYETVHRVVEQRKTAEAAIRRYTDNSRQVIRNMHKDMYPVVSPVQENLNGESLPVTPSVEPPTGG